MATKRAEIRLAALGWLDLASSPCAVRSNRQGLIPGALRRPSPRQAMLGRCRYLRCRCEGEQMLLEAQQSTGTRRECLQPSLEVRVRLTHPMTACGQRDALVPNTRRPQVGPLENPRKPASATTSQRFHSFLPFHSRPYNPFLNLTACCPARTRAFCPRIPSLV